MSESENDLSVHENERLCRILQQATEGDESTLPVVRAVLQEPQVVERFGGDLSKTVQRTILDHIAGDNFLLRESLRRKIELLYEELASENTAALEMLLIDRIVTCWLDVYGTELRLQQALEQDVTQEKIHQARIDRAHRRYLSATFPKITT